MLLGRDLSWLEVGSEGVPLGPYRALLAEVLERFGGSPVLEAGLTLKRVAHPLLFVLLNSDRPDVLIQKEARLARTIHSRHHVRIVAQDDDGLELEHVGRGRLMPEPTENLASAGQHIAMLEMIGAQGLELQFPRSESGAHVVYRSGQRPQVRGRSGFELWRFRWKKFVPARAPMPGLDDLLLDQARLKELEDRPGVAAAVERLIRKDLGRRWSLDRVARELLLSKRTLQRRLAESGQRFSDLVLDVRTQESLRLLSDTELSVTMIGYACGFSDTAHFTNTFRKRMGTTPSTWRREQKE